MLLLYVFLNTVHMTLYFIKFIFCFCIVMIVVVLGNAKTHDVDRAIEFDLSVAVRFYAW